MSLHRFLDLLKTVSEQEALRNLVKTYIAPDFDEAFDKAKNIVCVSPHPDDCEVGVGGLIARYASIGKNIYYIIMTDGSRGTSRKDLSRHELATIRRKEQEQAAKILGVKKIYWLDYPDGELPYDNEVIGKLIRYYRMLKPDIVLAPDPSLPYEAHPDHRNTGKAASTAVVFSSMPLFNREDLDMGLDVHKVRYIAYYYTNRPNYFIDITDYMNKKLEALKQHASQFGDSWEAISGLITIMSALYGRRIGVKYADAVKLVPSFLLHAVPFTEQI
ncbi:MAG: PIG-L deacetylase family protein [Thermoprotei archaeon]